LVLDSVSAVFFAVVHFELYVKSAVATYLLYKVALYRTAYIRKLVLSMILEIIMTYAAVVRASSLQVGTNIIP
jgi:hypothetical protein